MKKIFLILSVAGLFMTSCTDKFEEYNTDTKHPAVVPGEFLFSSAELYLTDYVDNTNVNVNIFKLMAQYWTETTYIDEANYDLTTRNIAANIWSYMYLRTLKDLDESSKLIAGDASVVGADAIAVQKNKLAIIELLNVYCYSHLVDVFGAAPYGDALNFDNVYPTYANGADIYKDLFTRLNAALGNMDANYSSFDGADLYYGGDVAQWIKFGNTLKVKLGITVADADPATAQAAVESGRAGAFAGNSDDCAMPYNTTNFNQLYADLVASGRHDFVPANTIMDAMVGLNDPRMDAYFTMIDTSSDPAVEKLAWVGGEYGYSNSFSQCSHICSRVQQPDYEGLLMTYTEMCFYLAEGAARGYNVGKTAEEWYNEGIQSSFDYWGSGDATAYEATADVAYDAANWKEKIGVQSWIANYTRGIVAYNNWRRLDYPILNLPENATAITDIPVRFTFPINEQSLNQNSYAAAASAIGGDLISTKVFWDKNDYTGK